MGKRVALLIATLLAVLNALPSVGLGFSGGEPLTAEEILDRSNLIVIARPGEKIGTVDGPGWHLVTLYRLEVESYIRPAEPGPDSLVVAFPGGMGFTRAIDGPRPYDGRALYFLARGDGPGQAMMERFIPILPLGEGDRLPEHMMEDRAVFSELLQGPRSPSYPLPMVRVNGRVAGRALLEEGRALFPALELARALGAGYAIWPDGTLELRRGELSLRRSPDAQGMTLVGGGEAKAISLQPAPRMAGRELLLPLRAVAEALGAEVRWSAADWSVEVTLEEPPPPRPLISEAEAVARLMAHYDAIAEAMASWKRFTDYFTVAGARLNQGWIDPRTGGERPVWELDLAFVGRAEVALRVVLDAENGEVLLIIHP